MVLDGRAAALWGAGIGYPGFNELAKSPAGARFIAPTADEIVRMQAKHAFLKPMTIPAGSYPGMTGPINSMGSWSFILARVNLDDEVAYRLAKTLHESEAAFCKRLSQACETTAVNSIAAVAEHRAAASRCVEILSRDRAGEVGSRGSEANSVSSRRRPGTHTA